jgi:hypothetical protein
MIGERMRMEADVICSERQKPDGGDQHKLRMDRLAEFEREGQGKRLISQSG